MRRKRRAWKGILGRGHCIGKSTSSQGGLRCDEKQAGEEGSCQLSTATPSGRKCFLYFTDGETEVPRGQGSCALRLMSRSLAALRVLAADTVSGCVLGEVAPLWAAFPVHGELVGFSGLLDHSVRLPDFCQQVSARP